MLSLCDLLALKGLDCARLLGVYRVGEYRPIQPADLTDLPYRDLVSETNVIYDLEEVLGYLDFVLDYAELKAICENPSSNKDWHKALAAVAGIYIIVEEESGLQYVGSAYGKEGILGRWMTYARTGHGGNAELRKAFEDGRFARENLRFSILRTLPKTLTMTEVVEYESQYKEKLGTRAFGLNLN